jgi:hypothetical protein
VMVILPRVLSGCGRKDSRSGGASTKRQLRPGHGGLLIAAGHTVQYQVLARCLYTPSSSAPFSLETYRQVAWQGGRGWSGAMVRVRIRQLLEVELAGCPLRGGTTCPACL